MVPKVGPAPLFVRKEFLKKVIHGPPPFYGSTLLEGNDTGVARELGSLMAENHGLDTDMESHPGMGTLTEQLVTHSRFWLAHSHTAHGKRQPRCDHPRPRTPCPTCGRS